MSSPPPSLPPDTLCPPPPFQVREKQSQNKSRQKFWELQGSKLGDILGVQKTAEEVSGGNQSKHLLQVDADAAKENAEGGGGLYPWN